MTTPYPIAPVFPVITDVDGQPLENGYVWVGQANLDPQTNPIQVYWDAGLTIPAAQPIRTIGGYLSRAGTPSKLFAASDFSIRVMDKNGAVVYSAASGAGGLTDILAAAQASVNALRSDLASNEANKGDSLLTHRRSNGTIATVQQELRNALSFAASGDYRVVAGILRQSAQGTGWQLLDDADHTPINAASVTVSGGFITVNFGFTATEVVSFTVAPDETYSAMGIACGASVGLNSASISVAADLNGYITYNGTVSTFDAAPWWSGDVSAAVSGGSMTVTHPPVADAFQVPVISHNRSGYYSAHDLRHGGYTGTSFEVEAHEDLCGSVSWVSGTTFSVTENLSSGISATWDNTAKKLIISHPTIDAPLGNMFSRFAGSANVDVLALNTTTSEIKWFNSAGAYLDTPAATHKLSYRLNGRGRAATFRPTQFSFSRGYARINPAKLHSSSGNLWFIGVFKCF